MPQYVKELTPGQDIGKLRSEIQTDPESEWTGVFDPVFLQTVIHLFLISMKNTQTLE